jgi:homopolymeric O-antigen transport system permease protein
MSVAVASVVRSLSYNLPFARAMAARDLKSQNKGSILGLGWLILRPLIHVAAYVTIITYVFQVKLGSNSSPFAYALHILSGLIPWQAVQRSLEEAPSLVRDRMDLVKQVVYPIETLPITSIVTSGVGPAVGMLIYIGLALLSGKLSWTLVFLPVPVALLVALQLGLSWIFMIIGVVLKDLREIVSVVLALMVYFSPVLLTEEMVGRQLWELVLLNPLAHVVICFRDVLQGTVHVTSWLVFAIFAAAAFAAGAWVVNRAKITINEYL